MNTSGSVLKLVLPGLLIFSLVLVTGIYFSRLSDTHTNNTSLIVLNGQTMGTGYRILLPESALETQPARSMLEQAINERLHYLDKVLMSTYEPASRLSLLNDAAPGESIPITSELLEVFTVANDVYQHSSGAFDISIKPLVDLWGFGARGTIQGIPDESAIDVAKARLGMSAVVINENSGQATAYKNRDVTLDLSAIAKGFAVDQVALLLENRGFQHYLVEVGGEAASKGKKPDGNSWRLGIETPIEDQKSLFQQINTGDGKLAIAASGNYRNFFIVDGIRYSHAINPLTGWPVNHNLVSVTVVHDTAMMADAWATALLVLGPEEGMKLANELQLAAYFIITGSDGFSAQHSDSFKRYIKGISG